MVAPVTVRVWVQVEVLGIGLPRPKLDQQGHSPRCRHSLGGATRPAALLNPGFALPLSLVPAVARSYGWRVDESGEVVEPVAKPPETSRQISKWDLIPFPLTRTPRFPIHLGTLSSPELGTQQQAMLSASLSWPALSTLAILVVEVV